MRRLVAMGLFAGGLMLGMVAEAVAQEGHGFLAVGEMAPEVEFAGGTRYGVLAKPVSLSEFRGETVVLAFFFRARTPG